MPQPGRRVNLYMNLGTIAVPSWNVVGQSTGLTWSKQRATERVAHKDSNDTVPVGGSITRSASLTGFYFRNDAAQAALDLAFEVDIDKQFRIIDTGVPIQQFLGKVTNIEQTHPVEGSSTYTITLEPSETPYNPGS